MLPCPAPDVSLLLNTSGVSLSDESPRAGAWRADVGNDLIPGEPSDHIKVSTKVPWFDQKPDIEAHVGTVTAPYDVYALVNRNVRSGGSIITSPRCLYRNGASGPSCYISHTTGELTVNGTAVSGPSVNTEEWQRIRIHVDGASSHVQVESTTSAAVDLGSASLSGAVDLFNYNDSFGLYGWASQFRIVSGGASDLEHAGIWAEMQSIADDRYFWDSELVTSDSSHNGFPGYAILDDGSEIMAYRKGTSHASKDGVIKIRRRASSVAAWGAEETLLDQTASSFDCRDVAILQTSTNRVVIIGDRGNDGYTTVDAWAMYSDDRGDSWTGPVYMGHPWLGAATGGVPVEISGKLYCPVYGHAGESPQDIGLCVSTDDGATWLEANFLPVAEGAWQLNLQEPVLIPFANEWCVISRRTDGNMQLYTSTDSGQNWTHQGTVFRAYSPAAWCKDSNGDVIVVYRDAEDWPDLRWGKSTNQCRTWTEGVIKPHQTTTEYAAPVLRSDNYVCVVASFTATVSGALGADIHYFERDENDL